jgi:hypothetical protein
MDRHYGRSPVLEKSKLWIDVGVCFDTARMLTGIDFTGKSVLIDHLKANKIPLEVLPIRIVSDKI